MSGELRVTFHAIERYQRRHRPQETIEAVKADVEMLAYMARPMRERTPLGDEMWTAENVRFVVKRDPGGACIAVTVLPVQRSNGSPLDDLPEDIREEILERTSGPYTRLEKAKQKMRETERALIDFKKKHKEACDEYLAAKEAVAVWERG